MADARRILEALSRQEVMNLARALGVPVTAKLTDPELREALVQSPRSPLDKLLAIMLRDQLKAVCAQLGLPTHGKEKQPLIDRILGREESPAAVPAAPADPPAAATPPPAAPWQSYPELAPASARSATPPPPPVNGGSGGPRRVISLEVESKQPRLAWRGMDRREVAEPVPTQVVEVVRPGRAVETGLALAPDTRLVAARDVTTLPPNRLIWTNDNLVALQTLLDERDPATHDYRYRGKVDLIYIDPPFMVNSDFRADNAIDIDLDEAAGVQVKKEPSLVEILAYKDTWQQGLDSFLSMLKSRLLLLKELLAPTGSIYVRGLSESQSDRRWFQPTSHGHLMFKRFISGESKAFLARNGPKFCDTD